MEQFSRNELYWSEDFQKSLKNTHVAVFGLGGVGGFALEALARAGVGEFTLIDFDRVATSNINRQLIALHSTVGSLKTDVWQARLKDINPAVRITVIQDFYTESLNERIFATQELDNPYYVVDAIDTLRSKIALLQYCCNNKDKGVRVVSSFGAGNRMDCSRLKLVDLSEVSLHCSSKCTFTKNVVARLKQVGITSNLPVVISDEPPHSLKKVETIEKIAQQNGEMLEFRKFTPASISTVPAVCGYLMANWVLLDLYKNFCGKI